MAENVSNGNSHERKILDNEITLMRFIISQCNKETLISGGQVGKRDEMMFYYRLPSGLHVYSERPFSFENIYKKDININELGNYIYITGEPVEELEFDKRMENYHSSTRQVIALKNMPFIQYRETPHTDLNYGITNYYFDEDERRIKESSLIRIESNIDSKYSISGGILIEENDGDYIKHNILDEYVQGSEYLSDIFQKAIDDNSKHAQLEMLTVSHRIRPLFEMLSIEKQKLQERENDKEANDKSREQNDDRMAEMKATIEGLKKLKLTQDEISYLEDVLEELRENNNQQQDTEGRPGEKLYV